MYNKLNRYAVGAINFHDNDLVIEIVCAEDEIKALFKHSKISEGGFEDCVTLEDYKCAAFNMDCMIDVKLISSLDVTGD